MFNALVHGKTILKITIDKTSDNVLSLQEQTVLFQHKHNFLIQWKCTSKLNIYSSYSIASLWRLQEIHTVEGNIRRVKATVPVNHFERTALCGAALSLFITS